MTTAPSIPASAARRLWANIEKTDGCWYWTGPRGRHDFPAYRVGNDRVDPARLVYELTYGELPDGTYVLPTCTTPHCCRPEHQARRDQFVPVPLGIGQLLQQRADDLYPDIKRGDHVVIAPLPDMDCAG